MPFGVTNAPTGLITQLQGSVTAIPPSTVLVDDLGKSKL